MHMSDIVSLSYSMMDTYGDSYFLFIVAFYICATYISINLLVAIFLDVMRAARSGPTVVSFADRTDFDDTLPAAEREKSTLQRTNSRSSKSGSRMRAARGSAVFDKADMADVAVVQDKSSIAASIAG
jgi:hypothetical protein